MLSLGVGDTVCNFRNGKKSITHTVEKKKKKTLERRSLQSIQNDKKFS